MHLDYLICGFDTQVVDDPFVDHVTVQAGVQKCVRSSRLAGDLVRDSDGDYWANDVSAQEGCR